MLRNPKLAHFKSAMVDSVGILCKTARAKGNILACGNGGSAADSEHFAGELLKSFKLRRQIEPGFAQKLEDYCGIETASAFDKNLQQGLRCIPLTSFNSFNSAWLNDCDPQMAFAQLVQVFGSPKDALIALSTSGNSKNVNYAAMVARSMNMPVISLTGEDGGDLKKHSDILFNVPSDRVDHIQEYHQPIYHTLALMTENELFGKDESREVL